MGRTKTKPFLKRKKVPKLSFNFGPPKSVIPSCFYYIPGDVKIEQRAPVGPALEQAQKVARINRLT